MKSVLISTLISCAITAAAQPCAFTLSGRVIDEHDGAPLAFAEVYIAALEKGAVADEGGVFRIDGLCSGRHVLRVSHVGCDPMERVVDLKGDMEIDLHLEHHVEELRELEVTRRRPDETVGSPESTIERDALARSSGRSLADVLEQVPGVTVLGSGPTIGKPVIQGLYGNRVLLLNNGVRQEDQQWGTEHAPNMDPGLAQRVTVVKGAASVQYGSDALGGVVIAEAEELPRAPGLSGEARATAIANGRGGGLNGTLQGGMRGWRGAGWRVQAGARALGDASAPDYVLSNTGLREGSAAAAVGWQGKRHWADAQYSAFYRELGILRASHIGNLTDLENAIESGEPSYVAPFTHQIAEPRQQVLHQLLRVGTGMRTNELDQLTLTYAAQGDARREYDIRRADRSDTPSIDLDLVTHNADLVFKHFIGARVHGKAGISASYQDNYNFPGTGARPLIPNYTAADGSVFLIEHMDLGERWEVEAGSRFGVRDLEVRTFDEDDAFITPTHHFENAAFTAGASWGPREGLELRAGLASGYRPPNVSELYSQGLHHGAAAIEQGDPGLDNERTLMGTIEVKTTGRRLSTSASAFHHSIANYILLRPDGYRLTVRGAFPVYVYTATDASVSGCDLDVAWTLSGAWVLGGRASIVRGWDRSARDHLFLMPADRMRLMLTHRRERCGSWNDLEIALNGTVVLEQTRFPEGVDFTDPPPAHHLIGLSAAIRRPVKTHVLDLGLEIDNLLNTAYRDYLDRFRYYADARGLDLVLRIGWRFASGGHAEEQHQ